ncbi:MAG: hypothetical protein M3460_29245 [Actinomycetota bacterium]|nr:hypothetical protein [Actinomycetota bacterium]
MGLVGDVTDIIKLVGETIKNTREIVAALKDASSYLRKRYSEAPKDLAGLLTEMHQTLVGLAQVTDVITAFQFTREGTQVDREPARFNNRVISRKHRLEQLRNSISSLKGSSGKMKLYADALAGTEGKPGWQLFDILGLGKTQTEKLGHQFNDLYVVDDRMVWMLNELIKATETALRDVSDALGPPGSAYPKNVPVAAALLEDYVKQFRELEDAINDVRQQLEDAIAAINPPKLE